MKPIYTYYTPDGRSHFTLREARDWHWYKADTDTQYRGIRTPIPSKPIKRVGSTWDKYTWYSAYKR